MKRTVLPVMRADPAMDAFDPAEWVDAAGFPAMLKLDGGGSAEPRRAECWIGASATKFHFAIRSELPPAGGLLQGPGNQVDVGTSDACEFFVSAEAGEGKGILYQILVAPDGRLTGLAHERGGAKAEDGWERHCRVKSIVGAEDWIVLCEVDLALFGGRPLIGTTWGVSCCRDWKNPWCFASAPADFMGREVRLVFDPSAPATGFAFSAPPHDQKTIRGALRLTNASDRDAEYDVRLATTTDAMPKMELAKRVAVPAGETAYVDYEAPNLFNSTEYRSVFTVSDGGRTFYDMAYLWKAPFDAPIWRVRTEEVRPFDFDFAYYPSRDTLRIVQSIHPIGGEAPATVAYDVVEKATGKVVKSFGLPAEDGLEHFETLPPLSGDYLVRLVAGGAVVEKGFERRRFEWEGNTLGKSRAVYPPFTPIEVKPDGEGGWSLSTVLRVHRLAGTGLLGGVVAKGKELFARPMELVVNGRPATGRLEIASTEPDAVVTRSAITGDAGFAATATGLWEVDGCLRYDLRLEAGRIDSLVLEIPLKAEHAPMIHALGRMRDSVSKTLPAGDGEVWNARQAHNLLCDGFSPYVLLSDGHRGFAFWAENDKGWSWDRATSNVEIHREGGVVAMRVNLVNRPIEIAEPRTITLGFMAAPVKPRPSDWLTRREDWNVAFLATDIQWFAEGDCGSVAPAAKNLALWDWIRRCYSAEEPVPDLAEAEPLWRDLRDYLSSTYPDFEGSWRPGFLEGMFRHHRDQGSSKQFGRPVTPLLYYNRSVWNNLEEYRTFMNEWSLRDFPARGETPSLGEIMVSPGDGPYLDYALWWYAKSFEYGNRGVYCDNYFNVLTYNTAHPAVYRGEDGKIVPANVIWALRDQAKRVRQMMCEFGMAPFFWPHMTSTMILPAMSFADGQLDWEWKYGEGPVQARFPEEYLKLATSGELAGVVPWVLWDQGGSSGEELVSRSFSGVMMLYGLGAQNGSDPGFREKVRAPYLREPSTVFTRFDDEGARPVSFDSPDVRWSMLSLPGRRATVTVVNWREHPVDTLGRIDLAALGLENAVCRESGGGEVAMAADGSFPVSLAGWGVAVFEFAVAPDTGNGDDSGGRLSSAAGYAAREDTRPPATIVQDNGRN